MLFYNKVTSGMLAYVTGQCIRISIKFNMTAFNFFSFFFS